MKRLFSPVTVTVFICALFTSGSPLLSQEMPEPRRLALLVGVGFYDHLDLETRAAGRVEAVRRLQRRLEQIGFSTRVLAERVFRKELLSELIAARRPPPESLLVIVAGDMVCTFGENLYLLTSDTRLESVELQALRWTHLLEYIADVPARQKLLVVDYTFLGEVGRADGYARGTPIERHLGEPVPEEVRGLPRARELPYIAQRHSLLKLHSIPPAAINERLAMTEPHFPVLASGVLPSFESDPLALTTLLEGFSTGYADGNADGRTDAAELVRFTRDGLAERYASSSGAASVLAFGPLDGVEGWGLATIDESPVDAVARERERHLETLLIWQKRGWISLQSQLRARSILDRWVESMATGHPLEGPEAESTEILLHHLRSPDIDEGKTAAALDWALGRSSERMER